MSNIREVILDETRNWLKILEAIICVQQIQNLEPRRVVKTSTLQKTRLKIHNADKHIVKRQVVRPQTTWAKSAAPNYLR